MGTAPGAHPVPQLTAQPARQAERLKGRQRVQASRPTQVSRHLLEKQCAPRPSPTEGGEAQGGLFTPQQGMRASALLLVPTPQLPAPEQRLRPGQLWPDSPVTAESPTP